MVLRRALPLLLALGLLGCPGEEPAAPARGDRRSAPLSAAERARVDEACARCHVLPPAESLPRARWLEVIPEMAGMPLPPGTAPLTPDEVLLAAAHYGREAPEVLPAPAAQDLPAGLDFEVEHFTPKGLEDTRVPAVANVLFARLSDGRRYDLIAAEMRSRSLFLLAPWAPAKHRRLGPLEREVNYPVHAELADVDGDGRLDVLVASIGGEAPTNESKGAVTLLLQDDRKQFDVHVLLGGLGRVADVRPADLDADGDLDLVVCAFGWRGPGQLLVLENRSSPGEPRFEPTRLDDRDGFIHVEPADLDGDGDLDLVTLLSQEHEQVVAFVNQGGLTFAPQVLYQAPHPAWGSSGLALADMDGDGDQDVLVSNGDALDDDLLKPYHGVSWLENVGGDGLPSFRERRVGALYGCERAVPADLDGDGDQDVVAVAFLPQLDPGVWKERDLPSVVWFERRGGPEPDAWTWTRRVLESHRCYHPTVAVADYDQDGDLDLAVGNYTWIDPTTGPRFRADFVTLFTQR